MNPIPLRNDISITALEDAITEPVEDKQSSLIAHCFDFSKDSKGRKSL